MYDCIRNRGKVKNSNIDHGLVKDKLTLQINALSSASGMKQDTKALKQRSMLI